MKRSRTCKTYSTWRQREGRNFLIAIIIGAAAAAFAGVAVYFGNHPGTF